MGIISVCSASQAESIPQPRANASINFFMRHLSIESGEIGNSSSTAVIRWRLELSSSLAPGTSGERAIKIVIHRRAEKPNSSVTEQKVDASRMQAVELVHMGTRMAGTVSVARMAEYKTGT